MDHSAYDVPDSSDWLNTPLSGFASLENLLHCQICKEFYDTPMITSCAHTFCSKCIRTTLSADGKCPLCTLPDQASKLRNNWAVQEIVSSFQAARAGALAVARKARDEAEDGQRKPAKRKRGAGLEPDAQREEEDGGRRTTRSKARRIAASQSSQQEIIEVDDSDADSTFQPDPAPVVEDGFVECPLGCGKRMKIEAVEPHLDKCEDEKKKKELKAPPAQTRHTTQSNFRSGSNTSQPQPRPQDRINELHYSSMKDTLFSKKLKDLGIPAWGNKQLMVNRHREWVNIWNANCDSATPRTQRELLRDLDVWERTQGGRAPMPNGLSTNVMRKDFDGAAYSRTHQDEFSKLIADARRKKQSIAAAKEEKENVSGQTEGGGDEDSDERIVGMEVDGADGEAQKSAESHAQDLNSDTASAAHPPPTKSDPFSNGDTSHDPTITAAKTTHSNPEIRTGDETRIPPLENPSGTTATLSAQSQHHNEIQEFRGIAATRAREPMFAAAAAAAGSDVNGQQS